MRGEDVGHVEDLPAFVIDACVRACRERGRDYAERVMAATVKELEECRDERKRLTIIRLLAKIEALVDQQPLPMPMPERISP